MAFRGFCIWTLQMYSCDGKAEFSAYLFKSLDLHPSEVILTGWFAAQETFHIIIINVDNFSKNSDLFFLRTLD